MGVMNTFAVLLFGILLTFVSAEWNQLMESAENFEGDIELSEEQKKILFSNSYALTKNGLVNHWPKNVPIPYELHNDFQKSSYKKGKLEAAMKDYEAKTCLRFVKRTSEKKFINFSPGRGCSSPIGMQWSGNYIKLAGGCFSRGTLLHEIAHSLGIWHEQNRPDRDQYVKINTQNMNCCSSQFRKMSDKYIDSLGFPYDYQSMMHYGATAFGNGKGPTIEPLDKSVRIGQRNGFSKIDLLQINAMYCGGQPASTKTPVTVATKAPGTNPPSNWGKVFRHATSSKCLALDQNSELILSSDCTTRFMVSEKHLWTSGWKCAYTMGTSSGSAIRFETNCSQSFAKTAQNGVYFALKHSGTNKCIHPKGGSSTPQEGTKAIIYHSCTSGRRIQFKEM